MSTDVLLPPVSGERRILRRPQVEQKVGLRRSHIYQLMREKKFPQSVPLGLRAVGWYSDEIDVWIVSRRKSCEDVAHNPGDLHG